MGEVEPVLHNRKHQIRAGQRFRLRPRFALAIHLADKIELEHLGNVQQALHIDVLAVEDVIKRSTGTMNLPGKLGIADVTFIHLLLDEFTDIYILKLRFHRPLLSLPPLVLFRKALPLIYIESVRNYTAHQKTWYRQTPDY